MYVLYTRNSLSMPYDINCASMTATGKDNQTFIFQMANYGLIIPDPGVGLPTSVGTSELLREALLEVCNPVNLAGY